MDGGSYGQEVERWRAGRLAALTRREGWLSLVDLQWLQEGENTVTLPGYGTVGTIEVGGGGASLHVQPGVALTADGHQVTDLPLQDDADGKPTIVRLGSVSFHLIRRAGRIALRVKDSKNPVRDAFKGIDHFPVDPRWRLEATFQPDDPPRELPVTNVLGFEEVERIPGVLHFEIEGRPYELLVFDEAGTTDLFVVFGDSTNGAVTYGGGRYLYAPRPDEEGGTVVDFNRAYNPPCVFTPHATCVLPLPENRLPIPIEAGEKRYT